MSPRAEVKVGVIIYCINVMMNTQLYIDIQDAGELIHLAVGRNQLDIVTKLIEKYGVDPSLPSKVRKLYNGDYG